MRFLPVSGWSKIFEGLKATTILDFFQIFAFNSKTMRLTENITLTKIKEHQISRLIIYLKVKIGLHDHNSLFCQVGKYCLSLGINYG